MRPRGQTPWMLRPAVAGQRESEGASMRPRGQTPWMRRRTRAHDRAGQGASMRPRGQTPWMHQPHGQGQDQGRSASMRPRGQTPWMRPRPTRRPSGSGGFNEATGADPVDARHAPSGIDRAAELQ